MSQKNVYVFIGPPGSGKGSLAHLCVQDLGWLQLSTGNLCRRHIADRTPVGKEIDFAIKSGNLVSDNLITSMVEEWLRDNYQNMPTVILDGYPRTQAQAQSLDELLKTKFTSLKLNIVRLCVDDDRLVERLNSRVVCQNKDCQAVYSLTPGSSLKPQQEMLCDLCGSPLGRRKDDEVSTVRDRLNIYRKHEHELLNYYKNVQKPIMQLQVDKPLVNVFAEFKKMIGLEGS